MMSKLVTIEGYDFCISDKAESVHVWQNTPKHIGELITIKVYNLRGELTGEYKRVADQYDLDILKLGGYG